jgi:YggT family protein
MDIILTAVNYFARVLDTLIFVRIIVSWLPISRDNVIIRFLFSVTEPILAPIRSLLSNSPLGGPGMMFDFSPIIAYVLIELAQSLITSLLIMLV